MSFILHSCRFFLFLSLYIFFVDHIQSGIRVEPITCRAGSAQKFVTKLMAKTDYFHHQQTRDKQRREQRIQKREKADREREIRWWSNSWHSTSACPQDSSRDQRLRNRLLLPNRCSILLPWAPCAVACCTC